MHYRKIPTISGSFAESDLQVTASYGSLPPCIQKWPYSILCWGLIYDLKLHYNCTTEIALLRIYSAIRVQFEGNSNCTIQCNYSAIRDMGWLQLVGSLKWYVSFARELYTRDCILQKRPIFVRSLLIVATPQCNSRWNWLLRKFTNWWWATAYYGVATVSRID